MIKRFVAIVAALAFLGVIGAGLYYYFVLSKARVVFSRKAGKPGTALHSEFGANEIALLDGKNLTLLAANTGTAKWFTALQPLKPPVNHQAPSHATPPPSDDRQLKQMKIDAQFTKLATWHSSLSAKRAALTKKADILKFNEEATRYQAALKAAQAQVIALRNGSALAPAALAREPEIEPHRTQMRLTPLNVMVVRDSEVLGFERSSGKPMPALRVPGEVTQTIFGDATALIVSADGSGDSTLTKFETATGKAETLSLPGSPESGERREDGLHAVRFEYALSGQIVTQMEVRLIEARLVTHEAMKKETANPSEPADPFAGGALQIADTIANDARREATGGIEHDDQSRYQVTLRRVMGPAVKDAGLEVSGPPLLFGLKTVDVVAAGKGVRVFDRGSKQLWVGTLGWPVQEGTSRPGGDGLVPCIERADTLYVADRGFLNAFDLASGAVRWRVPTIGIRRVDFDAAGTIYVTSSNAGPESLKYTLDATLRGKAEPVILKIDPKSGKILWKIEKRFDACYVSGAYVYVTRSSQSPMEVVDAMFTRKGAPVHFQLSRLNPRNGRLRWTYNAPKEPVAVEPGGREVALRYDDEVLVISSYAL